MSIDLKKSLLAGIFTALIVGISTVHAGGKSAGVIKNLEPSVDGLESVVVSIKSSPITEVEEDVWVAEEEGEEGACIAVQIGMNLLMEELPNSEGESVTVPPADEVILFLTLGGVEAVGPNILGADPAPMCGSTELTELIENFAAMEGADVVVCPLCWNRRFGQCNPADVETTCPNTGDVADPVDIHDLFLYADKILDF